MIVIVGATGNTGAPLAKLLLEKGKDVTVVSRTASKLSEFVELGARTAVGNIEDREFVNKAFLGAEAAYVLIPPKFDAQDFRAYQARVARNLIEGIKANGLDHVVSLSSYGAHRKEGCGVVSGLYPLEAGLNEIAKTNVLHLRAGYFYENFFASIPVIRERGVLGGFPIDGSVPIGMVHTSDIAHLAADRLSKRDFEGNNVEFVAYERPYTLNEAAGVLGNEIGMDNLHYAAFPAEAAHGAMVGMGMSPSLADQYVEFSQAVSNGLLSEENHKHPHTHTSMSLESFSKVFAKAYSG